MTTGQTDNVLDFNKAKRQGEASPGAVDADDIRSRLHADPRSFIEWLYSGRAFIHKSEARIGDTSGTPGASLSIHLSGPDAGLWKDHATDQGGDLIALYRAWAGYHDNSNFVLSLKEIAKDFFRDPIEVERTAWQPTPLERIEKNKAKLGTKPRADMLELGAPVATYRYYDTRGNVIASVVRFEPDGTRESKTFRPFCFRTTDGVTKWQPGAPDLRPLYRLPDISTNATVVLCEGEGCADALAAVGIPATSAMQGAHAPLDKTDWSPLAGKTVIIWPDKDQAGFAYAKSVSERLTALGCRVKGVTPPETAPDKWDASDCVAEGGNPHDLISTAQELAAPATASNLYKLYTLEELEHLPPPDWLVKGMITEGGLSLFWSGSDSFKTFVAIDIVMCVATGTEWHGRPVKAGHVVYVAAEDEGGVKLRMVGWRDTRGKGLPRANLTILRDGISLATEDGEKLINSILALPEQPKLIVIDTLQRTFGAGNENQTQDMNSYVLAADRLRRATGANVMIIHHSGRNTEQERGNLALRGACDTIITVKRTNDRIKLINKPPKGKQKNAEPFEDIQLRMQKVFFEYNGSEQSTLLVMSDDDGAPAAGEPLEDDEAEDAAPRLGQIEKSILSALDKAARSDRKCLGFISLHASVGGDKGSFGRALRKLVTKNLVDEFVDETDPDKTRKNYARLK